MENQCRSCVDCGAVNCSKKNSAYPEFCLTAKLSQKMLDEIVDLYEHDETVHKVAIASAEIEGEFYGKYTRVEEIMEFARRIGAKKIGIATCVGLMAESRIFAQILRKQGFEVYGAACKVGAVEKTAIGIKPEYIRPNSTSICNPILQAKLLNESKTDLNVIVGLCVGHDSLFIRYSEALCTTLVTKDRLLAHNPVGALYQAKAYYKRLLEG